jgi:hypothetical protein
MEEEIQFHYDKACQLAIIEVEKLARKAMLKHKDLTEFIMGMGSWSFSKKGLNGANYLTHQVTDDSEYAHVKPLMDFIDEWDDVLKITGYPMRFTAKGKIITDW